MGSLGGGTGNGGIWGMGPFHNNNIDRRRNKRRNSSSNRESKPSSSSDGGGGDAFRFPLKQAATAASLALTGDTIAQLRRHKHTLSHSHHLKDIISTCFSEHDYIRALRMTSYGFLLYGPGSYAWYQYLDHCMPKQTVQNLMMKVLLNQIVLGPTVIAVIFAWNNLWQGKLCELPNKYKKDALPTLLTGFRFWIPVSIFNFWVVPLQARVGFMSMGSIFWNFYLSSTMST